MLVLSPIDPGPLPPPPHTRRVISQAYALLKKPKKARKAHPLFARGFDTNLTVRCSEQGLKVFTQIESGQNMVVMDHAIHKVSPSTHTPP